MFAVFFFVLVGAISLALVAASRLRATGWIVLIPVWVVASTGFWLLVPPSLNEYGKSFGSFGVVVSLIGYVFVLIVLSLVCAVFAPVWSKWRDSEKKLKEGSASRPEGLAVS